MTTTPNSYMVTWDNYGELYEKTVDLMHEKLDSWQQVVDAQNFFIYAIQQETSTMNDQLDSLQARSANAIAKTIWCLLHKASEDEDQLSHNLDWFNALRQNMKVESESRWLYTMWLCRMMNELIDDQLQLCTINLEEKMTPHNFEALANARAIKNKMSDLCDLILEVGENS